MKLRLRLGLRLPAVRRQGEVRGPRRVFGQEERQHEVGEGFLDPAELVSRHVLVDVDLSKPSRKLSIDSAPKLLPGFLKHGIV